MESQDKKQKLHAREFHEVRDKDTIFTYDIENGRLIQLNELEWGILNHLKVKATSLQELTKIFSSERAGTVQEVVNELIRVDMVGLSPFQKISPKAIHDYNRKSLENLQKKNLAQIALNVTHKCNLKCDYCYGEDGSYGGPAIHMTKDTAKQAVDFLIKESADSETCRITFFGGEPLLNFNLVKYVIGYAKKEALKRNKLIYFGMTTNGVLLDDEKTKFLINEEVEMTFSFDGPQVVQDRNRPFKSKTRKSSYDVIYPKILKFIEKAKENKTYYGIRATLTRPGIINIYDVVDFFNELRTERINYDFAESSNISTPDLVITGDDLKTFRQKVREVANEFKKNRSSRYDSLFSSPLRAIHGKMKKYCSCISPGVTYVGVSAEGDLFPCHRFVGYKETKLGNVKKGFDRQKWLKKFSRVNIFNSKVCSNCWIRYFCGGLCPATNYFLGGGPVLSEGVDPEPIHCQLTKLVYEEALLLYAGLSADDRKVKGEP